MKLKYLIVTTLALVIVGALVFVGAAEDATTNVSEFYSWGPSPLGLAITQDGKTAYIPFMCDDSLFVVDLSNFTTIRSIDVSSAGIMLVSCEAILSPDESKLYVSNSGTKNVTVINTKSNSVEKVLPIDVYWGDSISVSHDGTAVYITASDGLYIVNGSDNSYYQVSVPGVGFESVEPSVSNPNLLYCIGGLGTPQRAFFTFNLSSNAVERASNLTHGAMRFTINSNETAAYFGTFDIINDKGVGNFSVFDLDSFQISVSTPIECGVSDFAVNEETGKIYIIGFWAGGGAPNTGYIREWDMSTNSVVREIFVSPSSDQHAIAIDPTNSNYLYQTENDFNLIRKVEISTGKEIQRLCFSKTDVLPVTIIRGNSVGYIACSGSDDIYRLNLSSGQLMGSISLPYGAHRGVLGYYQNKLYFIVGMRHIYSVNPSDGSLIETFDIGININPIKLTFFDDKMAAINYTGGAMIGKQLLLFDANNMTVLKSIDLPSEIHGNKVIASPDGSKLYVSRGPMTGPTVITVFNASTLDVINTIETPHGASGMPGGDFDETNRILYLCGFLTVYKIDMDTDELIGTLDVYDVYESLNIRGWAPTLSGVILSSTKDKLFVISGDAHSMFTYDLVNSSWTTKITNLKGYACCDTECSPDRKYLYTTNSMSDTITMVDLTSGDVAKIIALPSPVPIKVCPVFWEDVYYPVTIRSNSTVTDFIFNQILAQISFKVTGEPVTVGYCNVTIPNTLLWGEFTVLIDGNSPIELIRNDNTTYISLYFTYELQSTMTVQIIGTEVIPEFLSFLILPLFMIATLLAVIVYGRKQSL